MKALWTDTLAVCFFLSDRHSSDETQRQLTCNWHASLLSSCCPTLGQGLSFKLLANELAYSSSPSDADGEAGLLGCCRKMDRLLSAHPNYHNQLRELRVMATIQISRFLAQSWHQPPVNAADDHLIVKHQVQVNKTLAKWAATELKEIAQEKYRTRRRWLALRSEARRMCVTVTVQRRWGLDA